MRILSAVLIAVAILFIPDTASGAAGLVTEELAGPLRYDTAVAISQEAFPSGLTDDVEGFRTIIVATGENWPDALCGSALASALDAPILLTPQAELPSAVEDEIERLGATRAIILGGPDVVSDAIFVDLQQALGWTSVERLFGRDRYHTAYQVWRRVNKIHGARWGGGELMTPCIIVTGWNFPDAVAAAPLAVANEWPIAPWGEPRWVYDEESGDFVRTDEPEPGLDEGWLHDILGAEPMEDDRVLIVGGMDVVPGLVDQQVSGEPLGSRNQVEVVRLFGRTRYDTAATVAQYAVEECGFSADGAAVATGEKFPDALTGGVLQGRREAVMLMTRRDELHSAVVEFFREHAADVHSLTYLGDEEAVSGPVRAKLEAILDG